jgi:tetratricopeptide (TPR) repeat protein
LDLSAFPEAPWALDVLQSLLDQSLLRRTHPFPGHVRLGLYESVAEYARERLADPGAVTGPDGATLCGPDAARDRQIVHARWYGGIPERVAEQSLSKVQLLSQEWDNLIAGQGYALIEADSTAIRNCTLSANMLLELKGPFLPALDLLQAGVDSVALTARDRADLVVELGCVYHSLGHKEKGLQYLEEGVELLQDDAPCLQAAAAFHQLGRVLLHTGSVDKGVALLTRSVEISEASGEKFQEGITLGHLGIHHKNIGESEEALACYRKAIDLFEEEAAHGRQAPILGRMAYLHHQRGERELAMDCYGQALDRHRTAGNRRNEGIVLANLAAMHLDQRETEAAVDLAEQAVDIHRDMNDPGPLVAALDRRAQVHWRQGRMQEAEADLTEAAGLVGDHWPMGRGINLSRWGELRIRQKRLDEARTDLEQAVPLLEETNQHEQGRAFCLLAQIAWLHEDIETAKSHLSAAEAVAAKAGAGPESPLGSRILGMRERILGVTPF